MERSELFATASLANLQRSGRPTPAAASTSHPVTSAQAEQRVASGAPELALYLAAIVDSSNDAIISKDLRGIITTWNRAAQVAFGYTAQEAIGQHISLLAVASVADEMPSILQRIQAGELIAHYETWRRHKDGREIPVSLTVSPIKNAQGQIIGACKIARDITEQRHAYERFRLVVESMPNAIVVAGVDGKIKLCNSQTERLFGYERQDLLGMALQQLIPKGIPCFDSRHHEKSSAPASPAENDLFGVRKDGSTVPIELKVSGMSSPKSELMLASIVDITERKISENRLRRSLAEKNALLQEVHHRVKNNLSVIAALLSMQANAIDDEATIAKLKDSEHRVVSMALIHEQLYRSDDMSSIDLAGYIEDLTRQLFSTYAQTPGLTYRLDLAPVQLTIEQSIPCGLILNELITNALKHAYVGGKGEVLVRLASEGEVILTVSDTGVGFPKQVDVETSKSLGMTIIKLLATQLGGTLTVQKSPGTSVTLRFSPLPVQDFADHLELMQNKNLPALAGRSNS